MCIVSALPGWGIAYVIFDFFTVSRLGGSGLRGRSRVASAFTWMWDRVCDFFHYESTRGVTHEGSTYLSTTEET